MDVPLDPLTTAQEDEILAAINYSRSQLACDLASLKLWVSTQNHFPPSATREPDVFFSNFLVGCKGDEGRAKAKISNYYRFRSRAKDFCSGRDPREPRCEATWPHFQLLTLPKATPDGCRVMMTISGKSDYPDYDPLLIIKRILTIMEMRLRCEAIQKGEYLVMDNSNYSTTYFLAFRPSIARNLIHFSQNVLPWRFKGIISLNTPSFLQVAINRVLKPLIKSKIAKRWFVYTEGYEALAKHFPLEILPEDYSGGSGTVQEMSDRWMTYASKPLWRDWFNNEGSESVEESANDEGKVLSFRNFWG